MVRFRYAAFLAIGRLQLIVHIVRLWAETGRRLEVRDGFRSLSAIEKDLAKFVL
jgi:hypothetical protein